MCKVFCVDTDTAEDVTQDIFMRLWIKRKSLSDVKFIRAYLYVMAKNTALSCIRKSFKHFAIDKLNEQTQDNSEQTMDKIYCEELQNIIKKEIKKMPKQRCNIFIMSRIDGLPNEIIAEQLGISKRTVEAHISLALTKLRKIMTTFIILDIVFIC